MKLVTTLFSLSFGLVTACASTQAVTEREPADPDIAYWASQQEAVRQMILNFQRVRFDFDSAQLNEEAREALATNVDIMRQFPLIELEIEGHCDEVGSTEYNLALGQRRAESVRKYMAAAGIDDRRIVTLSYGEERLLVQNGAEAANRRAEFRVQLAHPWVRGTVNDFSLAQR